MNTTEAKAYADQRFAELSKDNPTWTRAVTTNFIIMELSREHNFTLTTPTGHSIVAVKEDKQGILYHVSDLMG
jgi:steroid 5-alpha reductase family enzyme